MLTIGTRIPSAGIYANNSINAKPRIPPSSIIDDCIRYSGKSITRWEWENKSGYIDRASKDITVFRATKGITARLILTI